MDHSTHDHRQRSRSAHTHPIATRDRAMPHWPVSFAPGAGISAAHLRHGAAHCPGCSGHPWPECACCGRDAVVAIADPGDEHAIPYCRACLRVLLAARRLSREEREIAQAKTKTHAPQQARLPFGFGEESASLSRSLATATSGRKRGIA